MLNVAPGTFNSTFRWGFAYTWQRVREQYREFQSAAGDPFEVAWSPGALSPRHQVTYEVSYNAFNTVRLSWFGNVRSGSRFTPRVAGDVNGDGQGNDRAFIFDPEHTTDPALARDMRALLREGSSVARACLRKQLGTIAGRESCDGPWHHQATLAISFNPLRIRLPQRAVLSLTVSNPLGLLDRAIHGSGDLRGWGVAPMVDPTLLYVQGFDAAERRYAYRVNSRFGATDPRFTQFRRPATVTAMVRIDLGPTRERQSLLHLLNEGRHRNHAAEKVSAATLRDLYARNGGILNPLEQLVREANDLGLDTPQADSLATMNRWYRIRLDSIWSPVARQLERLPDDYDSDEAYRHFVNARRASVDLLISLAPRASGLLTPEQRRKLPPLITAFLDTRYLMSIRSGTAGAAVGGGPLAFSHTAEAGHFTASPR